MAKCLSEARRVSKRLYDRAVETLGPVGITDVICLTGHDTSVSMTLAFYDVPAAAHRAIERSDRQMSVLNSADPPLRAANVQQDLGNILHPIIQYSRRAAP